METANVEPLRATRPTEAFHCVYCLREVRALRGLSTIENMWMHEYECDGILLASNIQ